MFNHVRSLLLNVDGRNTPGENFPGEEAVPAGYRPVPLPAAVRAARAVLFGTGPDRLYLNYRLAQYMGVLHATELAEYVTAPDPRVTYTPGREIPASTFGVVAEGSARPIYFVGTPTPDDARGRLRQSWRVAAGPGDTAVVFRETPPVAETTYPTTPAEGLSAEVPLDGDALTCRFDPTPGGVWRVTATARPGRGLPDVAAALAASGAAGDELFRGGAAEPYKTFRALWDRHPFLAYRLGGVLLAVAYRTDEARAGGV